MDSIIVDIDGTLADTRHRLHHLDKKDKDWPAFYAEMEKDPPNQYLIDAVNALQTKYRIIMVTGRPKDYEQVTMQWLNKHGAVWDDLRMRRSKDYRADTEIKREILDELIGRGYNIKLAIEDRPEVVRMWRENQVPCLQVDPSPWYAPIKDNEDLIEWLQWMKSQHHEPMFQKCIDEITKLRQWVKTLESITAKS